MTALERDGVSIAYRDSGAGSRAGRCPLVLVHGAFSDRSAYAAQVAHFGAHHRIVALDLRGHGASGWTEQAFSVAGLADDVAWLCDRLEVDRPVVIGHSLGGLVAVALAAARPDLPSAVIALDSPSLIPGWNATYLDPVDRMLRGPDFRDGLERFLSSAYSPVDDPVSARRALDRFAALPEHVVRATWAALLAWDPTPALLACASPLLYLDHGQPGYDPSALRELVPQLVTGQTVGSGHLALMEVPDQVNAMLARFIAHAEVLADHARSAASAA